MKFVVVIAVLIAAVCAQEGAVSISKNNVGDIITAGINLNAVVSSNVEANLVNVLLAALNQQAVVVNGDGLEGILPADNQEAAASQAESGLDYKKILTPEILEKLNKFRPKPEVMEKIRGMLKQKSE